VRGNWVGVRESSNIGGSSWRNDEELNRNESNGKSGEEKRKNGKEYGKRNEVIVRI
jgi:hypothetical protein